MKITHLQLTQSTITHIATLTMAHILDGKALAHIRTKALQAKLTKLTKKHHVPVTLAVILVGQDPASSLYVAHKQHACQTVGIISKCYHLPATTPSEALIELIQKLNADPSVDGILVQLPLPASINPNQIVATIDPSKDVDGLHPFHLGRLAQNHPSIIPCTPLGIIHLLKHYQIPLIGLNATVIGASNIVGRPMALALINESCTVSICHRDTQSLATFIEQADLVVSATGIAHLIQPHWFKPSTIVIDVGQSRINGKLVGDIDFKATYPLVQWITPVPGGVGPMTVISLLENTYTLAIARRTLKV